MRPAQRPPPRTGAGSRRRRFSPTSSTSGCCAICQRTSVEPSRSSRRRCRPQKHRYVSGYQAASAPCAPIAPLRSSLARIAPYRYGGGHGAVLSSTGPREPLDCSSSASLILVRAGLFEPAQAWTSRRFADEWGELGEGRYLTVWANGEHVWVEFKLDADHGERSDPTPSRRAPNSGWLSRRPGPTQQFAPRQLAWALAQSSLGSGPLDARSPNATPYRTWRSCPTAPCDATP